MDREDEYSRVEAIRALAGDSSPETEAFLLDSVSDANQEVRKAALEVLGQKFNSDYDPVFLAALYDEDEGVRKMAAEYLVMLGDDEARLSTVRLLGKTNSPDCIPLLITALLDNWHIVREAATRALLSLNLHECVAPLLSLAQDPTKHLEVRWQAIKVLGKFDSTEVLDALGALLADESVGREAGEALGKSSQPLAGDLVLKALSQDDRQSRLSGAFGVRFSGDPRAIPDLCRMLEAELPLERIYAADALNGIAGKIKVGGGQDGTDDPAGIAMSIAIAPLTIACRDEDANVRQEAVRALGTIGAPRSTADILAALQDTSHWVFYSAAEAAAKMKIPEVLDIFLGMFQGDLPDDGDRRLSSVICSLGTLGDQRACDFLLRCAESSHWGTKVEAAQALLALGDARKWDFLVQALSENNEDWTSYYRPGIAWAIAGSGDPRAVEVLLEALEKIDRDSSADEYLLVDLIESLASIGDPRAIEPIRRWQHFEFEWREDVVGEALRKLEGELSSP